MNVLVDTSLWIEFFHSKPRISKTDLNQLSELIENDQVRMILPIRTELLSGRLDSNKRKLLDVLDALDRIDPDWNDPKVWESIVGYSQISHQAGEGVSGIVDRMILVACERGKVALWTLDSALLKLAKRIGVECRW